MPISGIVITLAHAPGRAHEVLPILDAIPGVWVGEPSGARVPAVLDCDSLSASRDLFEQVQALEGVAQVELVYLHFGDDAGDAGPSPGSDP